MFMTKLNPLMPFIDAYQIWKGQENSAMITKVDSPSDIWHDLEWCKFRTKTKFRAEGPEIDGYFHFIRKGRFPKKGKIDAACRFIEGRIPGIGCVVTLGAYIDMLGFPLPVDPIYDCVKAYREHLTNDGAFKRLPLLLRRLPIQQIIENDYRLCEEVRRIVR